MTTHNNVIGPLQHISQVVPHDGVGRPSNQSNIVMILGFLPPFVKPTEMSQVCVSIDVIILDRESSSVTLLRFFSPICEGRGVQGDGCREMGEGG